MPDLFLVNAGELVTCPGGGGNEEERLGIIEDGAMVVDRGRVAWLGTTKELRRKALWKPGRIIDAEGTRV